MDAQTHRLNDPSNGLTAPWCKRAAKPSIRVVLGLALLVVFLALAIGMRLARQSTDEAAQLIGSVERQYEPTLLKTRNLQEALITYNQSVVDQAHTRTADGSAEPNLPASRALSISDEYARLSLLTAGVPDSKLRDRLLELRSQGLAIAELCRQRSSETHSSLLAFNSLTSRAALAARGFESGDQVYARKSLAELSRSAGALRGSILMLFASPSEATAQAAARNEAMLRELLRSHAAEFARAPGSAWSELMRDDLRIATRGRNHFLELERTIEASLSGFELSSSQLKLSIETVLQRPAWQALTQAAGNARVAAERTERHLTWVTVGILGVVFAVALIILLGIATPVRRLLKGTRLLARGALEARVPRGGVRELDELAIAFNDMAEALSRSQQSLRDHQSVLEERIAQRTKDLNYLAHHDSLTDLPNRRDFTSCLVATIEHARIHALMFAVVYLDIDNFKTINDTLGHQYGDRVLRAIAVRLQNLAGRVASLARLGGDEFTLVIPTVNTVVAVEHFMAHILREFATPLRVDDRDLLVSLSAGIALYPEHGDSAESLLRAADSALHDAKEKGRSGFQVYRAELLAGASHRFHSEQALRHGLANGDFLLYYQPAVSLITHRTTTVEALLRWRRPDGRIASAGEFIDIAEKSGLLLDFSDWLLRTAVEAARELRSRAWPTARVAINVSPQQFLDGRFVESVKHALRVAAMSADCLEIELTESALQTGRCATEALQELRRLGVSVALDDFGTGYSTFKSIEELPLTRVKLDQSLVKDVEENVNAAAFALSCVRLCQSRGLTVTVEGIERPGQLDALLECGDIHVQGFLIARPAPLEEIARFIPATATHMASVWSASSPGHRQDRHDESSYVRLLRSRAR